MPPPARIAFVTYAMHCGGMEALLLRLSTYFQSRGCEVEVITTIEPGEWFGRLSELDIRARHIAGYSRSSPLAPLRHSIRVSSRLAAGNFDLIFLNHARYAQASLARLSERVVIIPILHNDVEEIYRVGCGNPNAWNVAVAVSPKVAAEARRRVPTRPVLEISTGVELPDQAAWQKRRTFGRNIGLIFIGRLEHAQKGVLWLPEIYRACLDRGIDATLTIVGDGPDSAELQRRLLAHRLLERTRQLKGLTPEQVYGLLLEAHLLLMPSRFEGLPVALLESLACGCVPVASRLPGITDAAVVDGVTGTLVPVGDVAGFADAVATLYNDPERWSRMSHAAHESIRRRFSVETMGASYLRLVTDALEGRYPLPRPRKDQRALDLSVFSWRDFFPHELRRLGGRGRRWLAGLSTARSRHGL